MENRSVWVTGASRPHPHEIENGDAWHVGWCDDVCRVTVIDGLGHGREAALAAREAVRVLDRLEARSPAEAIRHCHAALRGTRGAVMGVASIDTRSQSLVYAGVGNIDGLVYHAGKTERLISFRGIVGSTLPTIRSFEVALTRPWRLLLHSDGVMRRFDGVAVLQTATPSESWLDDVLDRWARPTDDATVVLVSSE